MMLVCTLFILDETRADHFLNGLPSAVLSYFTGVSSSKASPHTNQTNSLVRIIVLLYYLRHYLLLVYYVQTL